MSSPGTYPAASMASTSTLIASSLVGRSGAKPPSSPTAVDSPRSWSSCLRAWYVSVPQRSASAKLGAPTGITMNSCRSIVLSAWAPPLTTFIIGTGRTWAFGPPT